VALNAPHLQLPAPVPPVVRQRQAPARIDCAHYLTAPAVRCQPGCCGCLLLTVRQGQAHLGKRLWAGVWGESV